MIQRIFLVAMTAGWLSGCVTAPITDNELLQAAQAGKGSAQYELANRLAAKPDYPEAMRWMKQAADGGMFGASQATRAKAALQVGQWYDAGLGEPKNPALANAWWRKASRLGSGAADYQLGLACQANHGGKVVAICIDHFESAAKRGEANAQQVLASWYASKPEQAKEATAWFAKAATQGNRDAQYELARRYELGEGGAKVPAEAERWYAKAAAQKQPDALLWMARQSQGDEAIGYYQQAAHADAVEAQLWLARAYLSGEGMTRDESMGRYWLERAATQGSHEAEYQLSLQQTESQRRLHYLQLAAAGGVARAQYGLATWLQEQGDDPQARQWLAKAAAQGLPEAQFAYGEMLRWGQGGKENYAEAFRHYRLAAATGNRMAQYRMGTMREEGLGAPRNRLHAYAWYALAATEGMEEAQKAREELEGEMKSDEIKKAQQLAQHWFKRLPDDAS